MADLTKRKWLQKKNKMPKNGHDLPPLDHFRKSKKHYAPSKLLYYAATKGFPWLSFYNTELTSLCIVYHLSNNIVNNNKNQDKI